VETRAGFGALTAAGSDVPITRRCASRPPAADSHRAALGARRRGIHRHSSGCAGLPVETQTQSSGAERTVATAKVILFMASSLPRTRQGRANPRSARRRTWGSGGVVRTVRCPEGTLGKILLTHSNTVAHCGASGEPSQAARRQDRDQQIATRAQRRKTNRRCGGSFSLAVFIGIQCGHRHHAARPSRYFCTIPRMGNTTAMG
jgi:hypothetical protein